MTPQEFDREILRLDNQWPKAYGPERKKALWPIFKNFSAVAFGDGVTECLLHYRQAPLMKELEAAVVDAEKRVRERRAQSAPKSVGDVLDAAAKKAGNSEFMKVCMDATDWRVKNKINPESKEWQDVLIHLGKLCGMTPRQATDREALK
jgi:hypothetical protein